MSVRYGCDHCGSTSSRLLPVALSLPAVNALGRRDLTFCSRSCLAHWVVVDLDSSGCDVFDGPGEKLDGPCQVLQPPAAGAVLDSDRSASSTETADRRAGFLRRVLRRLGGSLIRHAVERDTTPMPPASPVEASG